MNRIGPTVRKIRESKNLSQGDLAAKINLQGWDISRGTLAKIESQCRRVTDGEVLILAKSLKVDVGILYKSPSK